MKINAIMSPDNLIIGLKANSKKQVLQEITRRMIGGLDNVKHSVVLDLLMERERLGCTGIGDGIAIPHARCPFADQDQAPIASLAILERPIDYQAHDDKPVDIIFTLLAPKQIGGEHLTALALASRVLRDVERTEKLRGCTNIDAAWSILNAESISTAA